MTLTLPLPLTLTLPLPLTLTLPLPLTLTLPLPLGRWLATLLPEGARHAPCADARRSQAPRGPTWPIDGNGGT